MEHAVPPMGAFGAQFVEVRVGPEFGAVRVARVASSFAATGKRVRDLLGFVPGPANVSAASRTEISEIANPPRVLTNPVGPR